MPGSAKSIVVMGSDPEGTPLMSDAVQWGDVLYLSGRAAVDPETLRLRPGGFGAQAAVVFDDIGTVLAAFGYFGNAFRPRRRPGPPSSPGSRSRGC